MARHGRRIAPGQLCARSHGGCDLGPADGHQIFRQNGGRGAWLGLHAWGLGFSDKKKWGGGGGGGDIPLCLYRLRPNVKHRGFKSQNSKQLGF